MSIIKVVKNNYTVEPLYQWDRDQVLQVYGLSLALVPEVHFTNQAMSRAIVRQATMDAAGVVTVDVPNSLLQKPYTITAYICGYNGTTFETYYKLEVPVKERQQPADYTLTDDPEVYSFKALENAVQNALTRLSAAEDKLDTATADMKNAEAVLKQAVKDIENTVNENVQAALPGFLDDTLTDPAKAAPAGVVGAALSPMNESLGVLAEQYKIEKIAEVVLTTATEAFYVELPQALSNYPILFIMGRNLKSGAQNKSGSVYAVESTESTESLGFICTFELGDYDGGVKNDVKTSMVAQSYENAAKAMYLRGNCSNKFQPGCHFEFWGAVK